MTLDLTLDCDERCFQLPQWKEVLTRDPDRHIFATPEWNRVWWEEFGQGKDLFLLTMRRGSELVAIVPLYRKHDGGRKILRFLGGIELTDYLGPICAVEDRQDVVEALVSWLGKDEVEWDEFDAHNMPVPFGFGEFLIERADRHGYRFEVEQEETSAILLLPTTWETYLESLDPKERRELKRKNRRIVREAPDLRFRTATEESLEEDLKYFIDMHRGAEGHKGHFMKPEVAAFFERVARSLMPLGWLRIDLLEIAGLPVASTFSFELGGRFYLYNSAYEPEMKRLSPGVVLVSRLIEDSIDRGLTKFDFLRGQERYKYQLGAQPVPLNNVRLFNRAA
ncbi:MAG: GNAT family N-acetyltransferase [Actinobacteria bacterium]|nr:GNAT family N-acetyltransferase [Actinomycetota bacterium]